VKATDAFDNETEFHEVFGAMQEDSDVLLTAGELAGDAESVSGTVYEPGDCGRAAAGHFVRRMVDNTA
jgi:hypothetical protein